MLLRLRMRRSIQGKSERGRVAMTKTGWRKPLVVGKQPAPPASASTAPPTICPECRKEELKKRARCYRTKLRS
jgi:hypothetical protein